MNVNEVFSALAAGKLEQARQRVSRYVGLSIWLVVVFCVTYVSLSPTVYDFFGLENLNLPFAVLAVMTLSLVLETHHSFHALIYLSTNKVPFFWEE